MTATRDVRGDLERYAVATSLVIIDDEACVRCGHCASSCAEVHADGVSRLVRRGEKVRVRDASDGTERALIVPGACQHCKHAACTTVCPTHAIGRAPDGQILVNEDACVGCGQCEKACPWGGVHMAPRPMSASAASSALSPQVAVKCDLCVGRDEGPACVRACPVEALARVEPRAAMVEVRAAVQDRPGRAPLPRPRSGASWLAAAAMLAVAWQASPGAWRRGWTSGVILAVLVFVLTGYAIAKRSSLARSARMPGARAQAVAHASLGLLATGVAIAHASARIPPSASGAAVAVFLLAIASGAVVSLTYALAPKALSRVERRALLAEDLAARGRELDDKAFGALTGRPPATKALYVALLAPYAASVIGPLALIALRRTLREEEERLQARVAAVGRRERMNGERMDDLVRLVVERRSVRAQRWLQGGLRAVVPVHVAAVALALVLIVIHVAVVAGRR